jgi:hypothetical protein
MNDVVLLTGPTSAIGERVHASLTSRGTIVINCYSSPSAEERAYFNLLTGENNLSLYQFDRVIHLAWVMRDRSKEGQLACQLQTQVLAEIAKSRNARFDFLSSVEAEGGESNYAIAKLSVEKTLETFKNASVVRAGIIWGADYLNPLLESLSTIANIPGVCPHVDSKRRFFFTSLSALSEDIGNCKPGARISSFSPISFSIAELCHRLRRKRAFMHLSIPFYPVAGLLRLLNRIGLHTATMDRLAALGEPKSDTLGYRYSEYGKNHGLPFFIQNAS